MPSSWQVRVADCRSGEFVPRFAGCRDIGDGTLRIRQIAAPFPAHDASASLVSPLTTGARGAAG